MLLGSPKYTNLQAFVYPLHGDGRLQSPGFYMRESTARIFLNYCNVWTYLLLYVNGPGDTGRVGERI
jgi:hypothetical protein